MAITLEVWGDYALFTRPEMKVERVTYDVMTPSAARGLIESIYWHPGMKWCIDYIYVCNPIRYINVRRNEVESKISANTVKTAMGGGGNKMYLSSSQNIQQRASLMLRDVRYVIKAHFELTESAEFAEQAGKFQSIIKRRIRKGQFYHQPCFGCREFPAQFRWCEDADIPPRPEELKGERDLGWMLYDMDYSDSNNITPCFFRGVLRDGVLQVPSWDSEEVRR